MSCNNVQIVVDHNKCVGCLTCKCVCNNNAIREGQSRKGFYIPKINNKACINCGLCLKYCPSNKNSISLYEPKKVYACFSNNDKVLRISSSGGIFSEIVYSFLNKYPNASVFSASFNNNLMVEHSRLTNLTQLPRFVGSKYVQSSIGNIMTELLNDIQNDKKIIFIGTPCQCNAIRTFLLYRRKTTDGIFFVDFLCHGVPSPRIWHDYMHELEKHYDKKIVNYVFRNKEIGWKGINPSLFFEDGTSIKHCNHWLIDSYAKLFGRLSLNPSCFRCSFTKYNRVGDITIGDFWNIEKSNLQIETKNGVSRVSVNTEKGEYLFALFKNNVFSVAIDDKSIMQDSLRKPVKRNMLDFIFWKVYFKKGYYASSYLFTNSGLVKIKNRLKHMLKK